MQLRRPFTARAVGRACVLLVLAVAALVADAMGVGAANAARAHTSLRTPVVTPMVIVAPHVAGAAGSFGVLCTAASTLASSAASGGWLSFKDLAAAYDLDPLYRSGDLGAGATVALVEFARFRPHDVTTFQSCIGARTKLRTLLVDGGPTPAVGASATLIGELEADLDVEEVMALAPAAHIVVVEGSDATPTGVLDTYAAAVASGANVISTSWGSCEASINDAFATDEATIFQRAASLDETVVAAAGDDGSEDCYDGQASSGGLAVGDPASQPYVTAVGGTTLLPSGHGLSQRVWNQGAADGAGGGGVSTIWSMPSYQVPLATSAVEAAGPGACSSALGSCRAVPDVSADAGTPILMYCTERTLCDGWSLHDGTSVAAPLWASIFALADANRACAGQPLGFVNPALYAIAGGTHADRALTGIISGDNDLFSSTGAFPATSGYNLASGLGSPVAGNGHDGRLVAQLCAMPRTAVATPVPTAATTAVPTAATAPS